jgi:hypothetical protein
MNIPVRAKNKAVSNPKASLAWRAPLAFALASFAAKGAWAKRLVLKAFFSFSKAWGKKIGAEKKLLCPNHKLPNCPAKTPRKALNTLFYKN